MVILDASAATEIARKTEKGNAFLSLIEDGEAVASSEIMQIEVRNAFWKFVCFEGVPKQEAQACIANAVSLVDDFLPIEDYGEEAFLEAVNYRHPVYDMLYLCAARRNKATLLTADRKLMKLCGEAGVDCVCEVPF